MIFDVIGPHDLWFHSYRAVIANLHLYSCMAYYDFKYIRKPFNHTQLGCSSFSCRYTNGAMITVLSLQAHMVRSPKSAATVSADCQWAKRLSLFGALEDDSVLLPSTNISPVTRLHLTVPYDLPYFPLPPPSFPSLLSYPCLFPPPSQPPIAAAKDRSPVARPSPSMPKTPVEGVGILRISG